jgi:hypothetical protein
VRLVYLDEAGISNPSQEPFVVVAGVIIDADRQFKAIESHIDGLARKYLPEAMQGRVPFHAMELWHGTKNFDRQNWPLEKRLEILTALADVPRQFDIPICWGSTDRKTVPELISGSASSVLIEQISHGHAFFKFVVQVETVMRAVANQEVAMLIAEDRSLVRKMLKVAHSILRGRADPAFQAFLPEMLDGDSGIFKFVLPLERIVETVHFADKRESSLLQIADLCAFVIKRNIMKATHSEQLFSAIQNQIIFTPKVAQAIASSAQPS